MRDVGNRVVLITGSTAGLGRRVAQDLAAGGFRVLLHGRSRPEGEAAVREIREDTGNGNLAFYDADLASLDAVRRLAERIAADHEHLDVLVNNAGIGAGKRSAPRETSIDGYELRFAVNYLAHFALTLRLLSLMGRRGAARIVNVSSIGQQPIDFGDVMLERGYDGLRAYRQSKLAQVMFTFDLAEDLRGTPITVNCLHPASLMPTRMVAETDYFEGPVSTVEEGARAVEYLATSPELEGVTGEYFEGRRRARADAQAYDPKARRRLRALSVRLSRIDEAAS